MRATPSYPEMLHVFGETLQNVANGGAQLVVNLSELETDFESLKDICGWPGWQTVPRDRQRHPYRGQVEDVVDQSERLAILRERLRRLSVDFDRGAELLKQRRDALAELIAK